MAGMKKMPVVKKMGGKPMIAPMGAGLPVAPSVGMGAMGDAPPAMKKGGKVAAKGKKC